MALTASLGEPGGGLPALGAWGPSRRVGPTPRGRRLPYGKAPAAPHRGFPQRRPNPRGPGRAGPAVVRRWDGAAGSRVSPGAPGAAEAFVHRPEGHPARAAAACSPPPRCLLHPPWVGKRAARSRSPRR